MNAGTWQLIVALVVVAGAVAVLARRVYRLIHGTPSRGCGSGGYGSCATDAPQTGAEVRPLVGLNLTAPSNDVPGSSREKDA